MKPILFNTEMVRAILDGRKTVTRRAIKPPALYAMAEDASGKCIGSYYEDENTAYVYPTVDDCEYQPCDILYVRESFAEIARIGPKANQLYADVLYAYRADGPNAIVKKWRPSIHMPRKAARLFLRVTSVRVERLHDITEEQAQKEGFIPIDASAITDFAEIWNRTVKLGDREIYGWDANPWVFVIEFERITKEEAFAHG